MNTIKWLLGLVFLVASLLAGAAYGIYYGLTQPLLISEPQEYQVEAGYTANRVGDQFAARGWIYHPMLVRAAMKLNPQWVLKVGKYRLEPDMSLLDALALIDSGKAIFHEITLLEGKTVKDYIQLMAAKGNIEMTLEGASLRQIAEALGTDYPSAEGLIFANTYRYHDGDRDIDILLHAHDALNQQLEQAWQQRSPKLPLTDPYSALIMASIIEKETGVPEERGLISGVFVNRLRKNIRLQTDPTVIYGLGDRFNGNLTRAHLREDTPFNTYRIYGLPPTPIANVGKAALLAAVQPEHTDALYFVARGDGTHQFSRTLREHNEAVAHFQKYRRRSDYQSSPNQ